MKAQTTTEENYLKALYRLSYVSNKDLSVNELAAELGISAPTTTTMLQKLSIKKLIHYEKYKPFRLTKKGVEIAIQIVRKHRLWELYLVKRMGFKWDEVHEVAEQLEHIQSAKLVDRIDELLGFPQFDPHGDPIPDANGNLPVSKSISLSKAKIGESYKVTGVTDHSTSYMNYLDNLQIGLGKKIKLVNVIQYDGSVVVNRSPSGEITLSHLAALHLRVEKI